LNLSNYLKTWEGTQAENKWGRIFQAGLILIVLLLVIKVFSKETIITIQPYTLSEDAWITKTQSSTSYKEAWGFAFAQLLGNVTPGNVDFIKERIIPLLSPNIYQSTLDAIEIQAKQIKNNRVTMRFEPRFVEYEPISNKVFIYGYSFVKGTSSKAIRSERSYEFSIKISNYMPVFDYIDTYLGKPHTKKILERIEQKAKSYQENHHVK